MATKTIRTRTVNTPTEVKETVMTVAMSEIRSLITRAYPELEGKAASFEYHVEPIVNEWAAFYGGHSGITGYEVTGLTITYQD